jgi:hypothetical protein
METAAAKKSDLLNQTQIFDDKASPYSNNSYSSLSSTTSSSLHNTNIIYSNNISVETISLEDTIN